MRVVTTEVCLQFCTTTYEKVNKHVSRTLSFTVICIQSESNMGKSEGSNNEITTP